jgi:Flp pilus assembly protein TadG
MQLRAIDNAKQEGGATLAEFAFTLPLLAILLYVVFDFGSALSTKQKLGSAVYECARAGASQSTSDLTNGAVGGPASVADLRDTVANSLLSAGVSDCGLLGGGTLTATPAVFRWSYTANTGCGGTLRLTIERQNVVTGGTVNVIYTHVHLEYPFRWRLANVIQLIPGGAFPASTTLAVDANMQNLN